MKISINPKQTRIAIIAYILSGAMVSASAAQQHAIKPIDPASIDLTQPTLFIVPYSHLDDV